MPVHDLVYSGIFVGVLTLFFAIAGAMLARFEGFIGGLVLGFWAIGAWFWVWVIIIAIHFINQYW